MRCPMCESIAKCDRGSKGDIHLRCDDTNCGWSFLFTSQKRLRLGSKVRGVAGNDYLTAAISILNGSTYNSYAQQCKSYNVHAISEKTFYKFIYKDFYSATVKVWNRKRKDIIIPEIYKLYAEKLNINTDIVCPIAVEADTRWQKRGTGKQYNSLDSTTFAVEILSGLVLSVQNCHGDTPTGSRSKIGGGKFNMSSSMLYVHVLPNHVYSDINI